MARENAGGSPKSKVVVALIIGMVLGLAIASILAWFLFAKTSDSFTNKERRDPAKSVAPEQAVVASAPVAASAVGGQSYEFYKVLPDKSDTGVAHKQPAPKPQVTTPATPSKPLEKQVVDNMLYFVQAGSFQNIDDAEKLKAKLAIVGMEASVQKADVPGKGVFHRVRLGPYKGMTDTNAAIASLKQNGINNAAAMHAQ